ncbi:MAG TPA: hypothetical protein VF029_04165 [Actinomycetota bacterium]
MTRARLGALVMLAVWTLPLPAFAQAPDDRVAIVVRVAGVSFEQLLGIREVAALARAGGAGLLANPADVVTLDGPPGSVERTVDLGHGPLGRPPDVGRDLRHNVEEVEAAEVLVIVLGVEPTADTRASKDELAGVVLAFGAPERLFPASGEPGSLTSGSTRREGVVTGGDVRATLDAYLGGGPLVAGKLPAGEPIEVIQGPPPFELHERYLAQRRMYVPIGIAAALYVVGAGLLAVACLWLGERVPAGLRRSAGWACLSVPALATGLLAAGHLPELSYATAVPFLAIVTVFGTMAFSPLGQRSPFLVPAGIGVGVLAAFLLEAALGWSAALTPFLGGSHLDGVRFSGLPNAYIGLLIGASVYVAHRLPTPTGVVLIGGVGLLAGLPYVGENLGAGVSLFAAAGLWLAVRERARLGRWRGVGAVLGVTVAGTAAILLAHAISPLETHVARAQEAAGGLEGVWDRIVERLQVGVELVDRNPAVLIPLLGLPVVLFVALRPPEPIRATLEGSPAWRDAVLVIALAGIVAYVANDTGPAAAGLAFGLAAGGLLGVSLLPGAGKMGGP